MAAARPRTSMATDVGYQLAQLTGLPVETVIALERNDLSRLSADIDPSTALRTYAAAVGLDAVWEQGTDRVTCDVCLHWADEFDWRAQEHALTPRMASSPH